LNDVKQRFFSFFSLFICSISLFFKILSKSITLINLLINFQLIIITKNKLFHISHDVKMKKKNEKIFINVGIIILFLNEKDEFSVK
jgi:hypothetical protein